MGALLCMSVSTLVAINHKNFYQADAVSLPKNIVLKDNTSEEIKSYYSSLSNKSEDELKGTNLLKNLKGIINTSDVTFFTYSQVGDIYTITDRDWTNSPASEIAGYDSSSNTITNYSHSDDADNNPYLHLLYCDYSVKDKTHYSGDGDMSSKGVTFDKEHAWSQSHGFKDNKKGENLVGAGTDLHHLKAGTQYGNRTLHNNYSYGFVGEDDGSAAKKEYETKNKRGTPLFAHSEDKETRVFEPQDSDKGDIARALLYMVACYNNFDGSTPTPENPALKLVNYVISGDSTGFSSDNLENGYYGVLQDILAWHKMDPVDQFEIHRNNLIYNNYQHNRNPFIDYPEWVDYIWGTSEYDSSSRTIDYNPTSTGSVDLSKDVINGYRNGGSTPSTSSTGSSETTPTEPTESKAFPQWAIYVIIGVAVVVVIVIIILISKNKKAKKTAKKVVKKVVKSNTSSKKKKK